MQGKCYPYLRHTRKKERRKHLPSSSLLMHVTQGVDVEGEEATQLSLTSSSFLYHLGIMSNSLQQLLEEPKFGSYREQTVRNCSSLIHMLEQAAHSVFCAIADCWKKTSQPQDYKPTDNYFGAVNINESFTLFTLLLLQGAIQIQTKFHTSLCTWLSLRLKPKFQNYSSNKTSALA